MSFISSYQLFLFDFDGLLVDTESLHFEAYQKMCYQRGYHFPLDFSTYLRIALFNAGGIEETIYKSCPELQKQAPWSVLYEEKKRVYSELVCQNGVKLMAGVERLLTHLEKNKIESCLVTHSRREEVELIRKRNPILNKLTHLITREDYSHPKPSPECYVKAIERHAAGKERVIGFEDSPRGLSALLGCRAEAVLVSPFLTSQEAKAALTSSRPFSFFTSLTDFVDRFESGQK